ncbi:hypothetical protein KC19_7G126800 [Ceratodon purpureus]|uniref:Uncharacterized protein n=1 Tax=Ceratodon purpureus TaxID=3225 RepID=A0A8T0HAX6_CERPU|nr:hypothetical protein KC19_7G126800 [Ceratodon purpureus]
MPLQQQFTLFPVPLVCSPHSAIRFSKLPHLLFDVLGGNPQRANRFEAQTSAKLRGLRSNEWDWHSREALVQQFFADSDRIRAST